MPESVRSQIQCVGYTLVSNDNSFTKDICDGETQGSAQSFLISSSESWGDPLVRIDIVLKNGQSTTLQQTMELSGDWDTKFYRLNESSCRALGLEFRETQAQGPDLFNVPGSIQTCVTPSNTYYDFVGINRDLFQMSNIFVDE
jgi:hypothetical protein